MGKLRTSIIPATAALAAFFLVLPLTGSDAVVEMVEGPNGFGFAPATIRIEPGQRISFRNTTGVTHTADCVNCPWTSGDVQPADERFVAYEAVGVFEFVCRYHPEMSGLVGVGSEPVPPEPAPDDAAPAP